ncbi:uncharacterized protein GIQ15_01972 [Arthroderma uncinatum]|uniref:uncharacterized protein n=1 Tax=Arthroderma uncinatum TaxID=74035 RepID=UPI00144AE18C|nr:uncharacterized protein GIQ15_01972 [Arthroderma uncinatum]KAF3482648.1 hypothetical protein GIQ15_01972 [Arthroderma uncinatum]
MGVQDAPAEDGNAQVESEDGRFIKEPDDSFTPNGREWPSLTIEVGLSERPNKLAIDARGWLEAKGSETQVVITANIDQTVPQITFHKWELVAEACRATRSSLTLGETTEKVICKLENGVIEVSGQINIPFKKLVGREKQTDTEYDIVLTRADLAEICKPAWDAQNFTETG